MVCKSVNHHIFKNNLLKQPNQSSTVPIKLIRSCSTAYEITKAVSSFSVHLIMFHSIIANRIHSGTVRPLNDMFINKIVWNSICSMQKSACFQIGESNRIPGRRIEVTDVQISAAGNVIFHPHLQNFIPAQVNSWSMLFVPHHVAKRKPISSLRERWQSKNQQYTVAFTETTINIFEDLSCSASWNTFFSSTLIWALGNLAPLVRMPLSGLRKCWPLVKH